MSKKRLSVLLSLCVALVLTASALCGTGIFAAGADVDASRSVFRFLSVETTDANATADAKVAFVINRNLGTNPFAAVEPSLDKVSYAGADGSTRTPTAVNYIWEDFLPKLSFTFAEDAAADGAVQYAVGDVITIAAGFTFKNWDGGDLGISFTTPQTVTFTENGWTGSFLGDRLTGITVENRTPGGINVRFGYTGVSGNQFVMDSTAWSTDNVAAWERMRAYVVYQSAVSGNEFNRFWIDADGVFTVTKADDSLQPAAGDIFMLKPGFVMWVYSGEPFYYYGTQANEYQPVFAVSEPVTFVFDGTSWTRKSTVTTAAVANEEAILGLHQGQSVQIEWSFNEGEAEVPVYSSDNADVASVNEKGVVSGLAVGDVTITAEFVHFTRTLSISVKEPLVVVDYEFRIAGGAVRDGRQYLVSYVGETLTKKPITSRVTAVPVFNDGSKGSEFAITNDMVKKPNFDNTKPGEVGVTFNYNGVTATIPVWLYEIETVDPVAPGRILTWGDALNVYFVDVASDNQGETASVHTVDIRNSPEYGIPAAMATVTEPGWMTNPAAHDLHTVGEVTKLQCLLFFGDTASNNQVTLPVGSVLTLTENFRFYRNLDSTWVAVYKFSAPVQYVWNGSSWQTFVAEAEDLSVESEITLSIGGSCTPQVTVLPEGACAPVSMTTENTDIISVENGRITALAAGEATVTVSFGSVVKTIAVTVQDNTLTVRSYEISIAGAAVRDGKSFLVAYAGEGLDREFAASRLTATPIMSDGSRGEAFAVTADMIDATGFDDRGGETSVTVTCEGIPAVVPVYVYTVETVDAVAPGRVLVWGDALNLYFVDVASDNQGETVDVRVIDFRFAPEYGITGNIATVTEPGWVTNPATHELYTVGEISKLQCLLFFDNTVANGQIALPVGSVLTLTENFRFYRNLDSTWVAVYKFSGPVRYVWTGSSWQTFVAEAEDFAVSEEEVSLPVGAVYTPSVTILPEGAYGSVSISAGNNGVVSVNNGRIVAESAGTAVVTLSLGSITRTITFTVHDSQAQGLVLANDRTFYVARDGSFDVSKVRVMVDYGNGFLSDEITLSPETASFTLDTSAPGRIMLDIACTVSDRGVDVEDTVTVTVSVQEIVETYPDNLICNDDNAWSGTMIMIYFQNTFPNTANVDPQWLTEEEAASITNFVSYLREGVTVDIVNLAYLTNMLTFTPRIDGADIEIYQTGDTILLKKGLCFYRWFGDIDNNNVPVGEGDFVKVGELMYDVSIVYNAQGKFAWHILPVGGAVLEETVTVALGGQHAANVQIVPAYATQGEWFYTVADKSVAEVSTSGMIRGLAQGQTTVTAVLRDLEGTEIATVTFTVVVRDTVSGLILSSDRPVRVDVGADLDLETWIAEFGIKAYAKYASGAQGGELIDISGARVTGFDPETSGEQTLTFRVTVDGRSVTGTLVITVGSSRSSCNTSLTGGSMLAAVLALAGAAVCLKKKGRG